MLRRNTNEPHDMPNSALFEKPLSSAVVEMVPRINVLCGAWVILPTFLFDMLILILRI